MEVFNETMLKAMVDPCLPYNLFRKELVDKVINYLRKVGGYVKWCIIMSDDFECLLGEGAILPIEGIQSVIESVIVSSIPLKTKLGTMYGYNSNAYPWEVISYVDGTCIDRYCSLGEWFESMADAYQPLNNK